MKTSKISWHILFWTANILIALLAYAFLRYLTIHFPNNIKFWSYTTPENLVVARVVMELNFIVLTIMLFYLFLKFRRLLKNLKNDQTFVDNNISLLKKITLGLLAFDLLHIFHHNVILPKFPITHGDPMPSMISVQVTLFFFALLMWGLRSILLNGTRLQQEKDLTI